MDNKGFEKDKYLVVKKENYNPETGEFLINKAAKYFVLRIDSDPLARKALTTYIIECFKSGDMQLADQLKDWLNSIPAIPEDPPLSLEGRCPVCGVNNSTRQTKRGIVDGKEVVLDSQLICNQCGVVRKF